MRTLALIFVVGLHSTLCSQTNVVDVGKTDVNTSNNMFYVVGGSPFITTKYVKVVSGTAYFNENWMRGKVMLPSGKVYDSLRLRLDLLAEELQYINPAGTELIATTAIKGVTLIDSISGEPSHFVHSDFIPVPDIPSKGWYQYLVAGTGNLYKKTIKLISERRPYGASTVEQSIQSSDQYYIYANRVFSRVKKLNELPALLSDKKEEISKFIADKKLNGKKESDYISVITYYNELTQK